jgi:hypothetical protein
MWSHADLVFRARTWLTNTRKCAVVLSEVGSWNLSEIPDAIGWTPKGHSILIECKASRADFLRDTEKQSRQDDYFKALGAFRYYFVPAIEKTGLPVIRPEDELPEGWGVLVVGAKNRVTVAVDATHMDMAVEERGHPLVRGRRDAEIILLVAELRRHIDGWRRDGSGAGGAGAGGVGTVGAGDEDRSRLTG